MKKLLFFVLIMCVLATCVLAKDYTLKSDSMLLTISDTAKNPVITSIKDLKTGQEFIGDVNVMSDLWTVTVKHDGKFDEMPGYIMVPSDAERIEYSQTAKALTMKFYNVKSPIMTEGFDVTCYVRIDGSDTYWDMRVSAGKNYGIWEVTYPRINTLNTQNGDNFMLPAQGDVFLKEFDNPKGFPDPKKMDDTSYTTDYTYGFPSRIQYSSLTKGNSTLYMSPEDNSVTFKCFSFTTDRPNTMNVFATYYPPYMGEAGHEYKQINPYKISVFKGDWFDAAKKYRKWGIESNYAPFAKGKLENRKDLPDWWKELSMVIRIDMQSPTCLDIAEKELATFKMPMLAHLYDWGAFHFDTHYPDWLPLGEGIKEKLDYYKSKGLYLMPYTNAHIIDIKNSETYKKYGDILLKRTFEGKYHHEPWAKDLADNTQACTSSPYYDVYVNEVRNIFKTYPFDGFYMDQVGVSQPSLCFDKRHNHPVGGGTFIQEDYNRMINDIKANVKEITGKDIPLTTEDGGDAFWFDGWLKCNENGAKGESNTVRSVIYSGYVMNFGTTVYEEDFEEPTGISLIQKMASCLVKGYALGWGMNYGRFWARPNAVEYTKNAAEARYSAARYFNLGEMVRPVKIISEIPKQHIKWGSPFGYAEGDYDAVRTCSYMYKGKAMICFTNTQTENAKVSWQSNAKDLYLKDKKEYKISEVYPSKTLVSKGDIKGLCELKPLETKIFIIE